MPNDAYSRDGKRTDFPLYTSIPNSDGCNMRCTPLTAHYIRTLRAKRLKWLSELWYITYVYGTLWPCLRLFFLFYGYPRLSFLNLEALVSLGRFLSCVYRISYAGGSFSYLYGLNSRYIIYWNWGIPLSVNFLISELYSIPINHYRGATKKLDIPRFITGI